MILGFDYYSIYLGDLVISSIDAVPQMVGNDSFQIINRYSNFAISPIIKANDIDKIRIYQPNDLQNFKDHYCHTNVRNIIKIINNISLDYRYIYDAATNQNYSDYNLPINKNILEGDYTPSNFFYYLSSFTYNYIEITILGGTVTGLPINCIQRIINEDGIDLPPIYYGASINSKLVLTTSVYNSERFELFKIGNVSPTSVFKNADAVPQAMMHIRAVTYYG